MFQRYKSRKEIKKRIEQIDDVHDKINYLRRIIGKKKLIAPEKRDAVYSMIGNSYFEAFRKSPGSSGEEAISCSFEPLFKSAEAYALAGETDKAKRVLRSGVKVHVVKYDVKSGATEDEYITLQDALHRYPYFSQVSDRKSSLENLIKREELKRKRKWGKRFEKYYPITTAVGVIMGLFFLSPKFTGAVIGGMTNSTSNILGVVFFVVGLINGFLWIRNR